MSEYLSKEEIRQWRSSLEKITLEEFALRLGKKINTEKETNDLADIVLATNSSVQSAPIQEVQTNKNKLNITPTVEDVAPKVVEVANKVEKEIVVEKQPTPISKETEKQIIKKETPTKESKTATMVAEPVATVTDIEFKKPLTDREQMVFEYFNKNRGQIVFAKDLAVLLSLPRDYVYKYIKNLRAKLADDVLVNSDNGGYLLNL